MSLLEIRDLQVEYWVKDRFVPAVRGLNFSLKEGDVLGIAGTSGCGKSTVIRAILGVLPQNARCRGEILYRGKNLLLLPEKEKRRLRGTEISLILQDATAALNPERKIWNQFRDILGRRIRGKEARRQRAVQLLQMAHLPDAERILSRYSFQLSGGMNQRIVIAMALALSPRLLMADEPTSAIDAAVRKQMIDDLKELQSKDGFSMVYVSHSLPELGRICNRILVMQDGILVEEGDTDEILYRPRHSFTKELLEASR